jgi:hypothetical protein
MCEGRLVKPYDVDHIVFIGTTEDEFGVLRKARQEGVIIDELRNKADRYQTIVVNTGERKQLEISARNRSLLDEIYNMTNGSTRAAVDLKEVATALGYEYDETLAYVEQMEDKRWIELRGNDRIFLTAEGLATAQSVFQTENKSMREGSTITYINGGAIIVQDSTLDHPIIQLGAGSSIQANQTTNIYNETIKLIEAAEHVDKDKKEKAKGILNYVKDYATPFLPVVAEALKKALGS